MESFSSSCFRPACPVGERFDCVLPSCCMTSFKPVKDHGDSCISQAEWQITTTICIFINTIALQVVDTVVKHDLGDRAMYNSSYSLWLKVSEDTRTGQNKLPLLFTSRTMRKIEWQQTQGNHLQYNTVETLRSFSLSGFCERQNAPECSEICFTNHYELFKLLRLQHLSSFMWTNTLCQNIQHI